MKGSQWQPYHPKVFILSQIEKDVTKHYKGLPLTTIQIYISLHRLM